MKSAGKARSNGLYRHIRTSKEIIRNLLNDFIKYIVFKLYIGGVYMFQGMEYIYEVYKEKSFSKAAAALFISQPSLSANVKRVENRIGYPIFDRSTKPLQLTEVGKHYIQAVEKVMDIENNLENYLLDLGNLKTGTLNVGGSNFFSSWILPPLIADFSQKFPHVQISLVEESTAKLSQFLQAGKLDLVIDNCILDNQIFEHYIYQKEQLLLERV